MVNKLQVDREATNDLWWLFILQGIVVVLFGLVALFFPGLSLATLMLSFALFAVAWGVIEIVRGLVEIGKTNWWWMSLVFGLLSIGLGVFFVSNPDILIGTFVALLGAFLLVRGVYDLYVAGFVYRRAENRILWLIAGAIGIIAAIAIWSYPVASSLAFVWVLGFYALVAGAMTIAYAFRLRPGDDS